MHAKQAIWRRIESAECEAEIVPFSSSSVCDLSIWHVVLSHRIRAVFYVVGCVARPIVMVCACEADDVKTSFFIRM